MIRWSYTSPIYLNPAADSILGALEAMSMSGNLPALKPPVSDTDHSAGPAAAELTLVLCAACESARWMVPSCPPVQARFCGATQGSTRRSRGRASTV